MSEVKLSVAISGGLFREPLTERGCLSPAPESVDRQVAGNLREWYMNCGAAIYPCWVGVTYHLGFRTDRRRGGERI